MKDMKNIHIMNHPIIEHKASILRDKNTSVKEFREIIKEISVVLGCEATKDLPTKEVEVETPLEKATCKMLANQITIVPILRAGLGMVDGFLSLFPDAKVGHIGISRDHETLEPVEYYCNLPKNIEEHQVIVVDPMLATGGSAAAAIGFIKARGAKNIKLACVIAAPDGVEKIHEAHPDVDTYVGILDRELNEHGYILPGLGDAGDRLFGTL